MFLCPKCGKETNKAGNCERCEIERIKETKNSSLFSTIAIVLVSLFIIAMAIIVVLRIKQNQNTIINDSRKIIDSVKEQVNEPVIEKEESTDNNEELFDESKLSSKIKSWIKATKKNEYIVTVIAQTTCPHCIEYKPKIQEIQESYGLTVYWFELNELAEEDYYAVKGYYSLDSFNGTPYTFITKNGKFIGRLRGNATKDSVITFLKNNNVIN